VGGRLRWASFSGMHAPPHMTCMYPPPHMTCMYPPPQMILWSLIFSWRRAEEQPAWKVCILLIWRACILLLIWHACILLLKWHGRAGTTDMKAGNLARIGLGYGV
jgi:hypothetical protein